ncbi:MAG TPA: PTS sugar transporter subunit IIA [Rectinema sp.]|jgi:PTS system fructose-specific IIC component/PTS system nitrogen regulatory IIA component|nr:PTS sugar transporter subunit IIA [Rectinema sp.]HPW47427.1 PTS sugar transporter subunit IIA [Rectinema sp.]HRC83595.1 PTS sugar transporter subunit IIA [Rectinema sp.]
MILQDAFKPATIKIELESEYKDELLEELVDILAKDYPKDQLFPREEALRALRKREEKMSTGIYKGVAVPHATFEGIDKLRGVIGISKRGIDFDSLDGNPVYLVFMLVSPPSQAEAHLEALRQIAILIQDPLLLENLMKATTPEKVYALIRQFEESLSP